MIGQPLDAAETFGYTTTMPDTIRPGNAVAPVTVTIAAVSDQLDLSAVTLDSTVSGGTAPYTYSWMVNGATTGLSSASAADPTFTPTGGGSHVAVVTVTDSLGATGTAAVDWTVGDADGRIQRHHADWTAAGSVVDFGGGATTKTIDGVTYSRYMPGTVFSFAAAEGVGLSIDPNSADAGVKIAGNALSVGMETDVVYYAAIAAGSLNGNGDQLSLIVSCASGAFATIYARKSGGVQQVGTYTSGGQAQETTADGGEGLQIALRVRGYQVEGYYTEEPFAGEFPAVSEMTKITTAPAGFFVLDNHHGGDTTDSRAPASDFVYWLVPVASTGAVTITHGEVRF